MFSWYPFKRKFDEPSHHGTECEEGTGAKEEEIPKRKRFRAGLDLPLGAMSSLSERERERKNTITIQKYRKKRKGMY